MKVDGIDGVALGRKDVNSQVLQAMTVFANFHAVTTTGLGQVLPIRGREPPG